MPLDSAHGEQTRFWRAQELGGLELLHARFIEQRFAPHVHEGFALVLIEQGAQRFRHRGAEHLAPTGSLVLINPDEVHTGSKAHEAGWLYRGFYPEVEQVGSVLDELELGGRGLPTFDASVLHDAELSRAFLHVHRLLESNASSLERQTCWREALLLLFQRHARVPEARPAGQEPLAVARARELLAAQLVEPPSLEALAAAVNLSPFHFARVFRKATGLPPHAWVKQRRLEQARALLKGGCAPASVAAQLGYADQSHLSRQFKQAYGVAPGEYRLACGRSGLPPGNP
ncbi:transcriptional regulator, AraC family [Pseudomonas delhiensis]|uniref:Transcriptional regulator, AraC family n=1 Tax=Pseudomonas delhiensis TaxID=366289 RepID=A0A239LSD6_9PSED|nr:AraC family transcriptional regulator [Pseudomonas delhiensis]SDJ93247.1 transcriptional regulator, AraC family [Pseudomonas delhiensis]SNT32798.1 transcriptional regulator, AraC family [Pseudomonas delhiensis]